VSREIRRVSLDFDFPIGQTWGGYLTDQFDFPPCPDCIYEELPTIMSMAFPSPPQGSGLTREAYAISQTFYPHMIGGRMADLLAWHDKLGQSEVDYLVAEGRLRDYKKRWDSTAREWVPRGEPVTAAMVNAGQHRGGNGPKGAHDAINRSILIKFRCAQLGITMNCQTCNGNGDVATEEQREAAENWVGTEPPSGEGYQLWQTVSKGGPVSPVFATPEELATWIRSEGDEFDGRDTPHDKLTAWIRAEGSSVGSSVITGGKLIGGVEAAADGAS
jgi:hypothetical protein